MDTATRTSTSNTPCLVCNTLVSETDNQSSSSSSSSCLEDSKITVFLLRNLLEIPNTLVNFGDCDKSREGNGQGSRNICSRFLVICELCKEAVKQASLIYGEIRELVKKYREIQKNIVETLKKCYNVTNVLADDVKYCRKLVNDCDFNGFGFPFVVQDEEIVVRERQVSSSTGLPTEVVVKQEDGCNGDQEILLIFPEDDDQVNQMVSEEEDESDFQVSERDSGSEDDEGDDYHVSPANSEDQEDDDDDQDSQNDSEEEADDDIMEEEKNQERCSKADPPVVNLLSSFICKKCLQRFPTKGELDEHDSKLHLKEERGTFPCPLEGCNKMYTCSGKFPQHFRMSHRKPPFICKSCKQDFSNPNQVLIHHKQAHPPSPPKQPIIKPEKTKGPKKLKNLPEKPIKVRRRKARPPKPKERLNPNNPFPCPLCHHSLKKFSSLRAHMKRSHPNNSIPLHDLRLKFFSPPTPPSLPEERKFTNPKFKFLGVSTFELEYPHIICERNPQGKFPCPWTDPSPCSKILSTKQELHRHIKVNHLNVPVYTCTWSEGEEGAPVCGRTFSHRGNYLEHYDEHRGTPKYKCEDCGMNFYRRNPFTRHRQKMHSDAKFMCELCGRGYSCQEYLNLHRTLRHKLKKGTADKKEDNEDDGPGIICDLCGQILKNKLTLRAHVLAIHDKVPGKHCCHLCNKRFKQKSFLNLHLWQRHQFKVEGYEPKEIVKVARKDKLQCEVKGCRMLFTQKSNFEKHRIEVHGEDGNKRGRWNCKYCEKNFFQKTKWMHCERTHENMQSRPEKCEVCGKGFPTKHHLRFHQRNTHKMQLESKRGQREQVHGEIN